MIVIIAVFVTLTYTLCSSFENIVRPYSFSGGSKIWEGVRQNVCPTVEITSRHEIL